MSRLGPLGVTAPAIVLLMVGAALLGIAHESAPHRPGPTAGAPTRPGLGSGAPNGYPSGRELVDPRQVAHEVARIRGLGFARLPRVRWMTASQAARRARSARARARRRIARHPRLARKEQRAKYGELELVKLAGIVPADFKLASAEQAAVSDVNGTYDAQTRRLTMIEQPGVTRQALAVTMAHELDHALDAQHFPAALRVRQTPQNSERGLAASALVEGTATLVELQYARRHGSLRGHAVDSHLLSPRNFDYGLPPALAAQFRFPYTAGLRFVRYLYRWGDGWRLVDRAFRRPPTSTEQILQPRRWLRGDSYDRIGLGLANALPAGWTRYAHGDSGQLDAEILLALGPSAAQARRAARDWDGGEYEVWHRASPRACASPCRADNTAVLGYRWDSRSAAARFLAAIPAYMSTALFARPSGPLVWKLDGGYAAVGIHGRAVALAFTPSRRLGVRLASAASRAADAGAASPAGAPDAVR